MEIIGDIFSLILCSNYHHPAYAHNNEWVFPNFPSIDNISVKSNSLDDGRSVGVLFIIENVSAAGELALDINMWENLSLCVCISSKILLKEKEPNNRCSGNQYFLIKRTLLVHLNCLPVLNYLSFCFFIIKLKCPNI